MKLQIAVYGAPSVGKTTLIHALAPPNPFNNAIAQFPTGYSCINTSNNNNTNSKKMFEFYEIDNPEQLLKYIMMFDIIVYVVDNKFVVDDNLLKRIMESIVLMNQKYNKKTQLLMCINKCDQTDYEPADANTFEFVNASRDDYEKMKKSVIDMASLNKLPTQNISFVRLFSELIYIIRSLVGEIEIPQKFHEVLGEAEFGKQKWKKFKPAQRKLQITKLIKATFLKKELFDERMTQYGFDEMMNHLMTEQDELDQKAVSHAKLKFVEEQINSVKLEGLAEQLNFISLIVHNFKKQIPVEIKERLTDNIIHLYQQQLPLDKLDQGSIKEYEKTKADVVGIFNDYSHILNKGSLDKYFDVFNNRLNQLYAYTVLNSTDFEVMLSCVRELKRNNYLEMDPVIGKLLKFNMGIEKWIDSPQVLIKYFGDLLKEGILTSGSVVSAIFGCIFEKLGYMIKSKYDPLVGVYITYCYMMKDFTSTVLRRVGENKYYDKYIMMSAMVDYTLTNLLDNKNPMDCIIGKVLLDKKEVLQLEHYLENLMMIENVAHSDRSGDQNEGQPDEEEDTEESGETEQEGDDGDEGDEGGEGDEGDEEDPVSDENDAIIG